MISSIRNGVEKALHNSSEYQCLMKYITRFEKSMPKAT